MITPIPITTRDNFSAVMSDDIKYLATNSGPQIIKFCNGIIAPLMKNNQLLPEPHLVELRRIL